MTVQTQVITKDLLRINQSKIKRLTKTSLCPQRYYLEEVTGDLKRESSEAMDRGHYFEYKLWGTLPKEGHIPILKGGRKKGSISEPQKRIDQQVELFPSIMQKHNIKIVKTNYYLEVLFNAGILFHGTKDALVEFRKLPYIFDLKLTANVNAQFGDFAWGNFQTKDENDLYSNKQTIDDHGKEMDLIQADAYMHNMYKLTKRRWGFLYGVFDYKATPGPEHKIIHVPYDPEREQLMIDRLLATEHKLKMFKEMNYEPIPSMNECKDCKKFDCPLRMSLDDVQPVKSGASITPSVQAQLETSTDDECPW